jgi:predicted dehydrogenase
MGAWQYSIPPSASPENIDWDTYLKDTEQLPFDAKRFFRYRNYKAYGTGIPGDLFVHLLSELHKITGSIGPNKISAMGGLRYWHDGRNVPDIMIGMFEYPETEQHPAFNLSLRSNFTDGSGGGRHTRLVGSEGEMVLAGDTVILRKGRMPANPGMSIGDFSEEVQEEYEAYYEENFPDPEPEIIEPTEFTYRTPEGFNSRLQHFLNFYDAIRNGTELLQDGTFGLRAAAPALACNISQETGEVVHWDPETMQVV